MNTSTSSQPLAGLRVVELSGSRAAAFGGKLLAEFGASVVHVEPRNGKDTLRRSTETGPDAATLHLWLNAGKESLALDLHREDDRAILDGYLDEAAVLLHGVSKRTAARWHVGYRAVARRHPHLVVAVLSPFGMTGPYADLPGPDEIVAAATGIAYGTGFPDREPLPPPAGMLATITGVAAAGAIVAALLGSARTGLGQLVDIASADLLATLLTGYLLPQFIYRGVAGRRIGLKHNLGGVFPAGLWKTRDGWVNVGVGISQKQYRRFLAMIGDPAWANEPRYRSRRVVQAEYPEEGAALIQPWFSARTREEVFAAFRQFRVPGGPVYRTDELVRHPFLQKREFFTTVDHPTAGTICLPRSPYRIDGVRPPAAAPAPALNQHHDWPAVSRPAAGVERSPDASKPRPLAGIRVLDLTVSWAGPVATQLLADLGAEVIKVESRERLDEMRAGRPILIDDEEGGDRGNWPDLQPLFHGLNRGKRSVTINLKHPESRRLIYRLIPACDMVISNLGPGVMAKLGLDYETLRQYCPDLIQLSAPAAGEEEMGRDILAYAPTTQALSGVTSMMGYEDGTLCEIGGSWGDTVAALHLVYGALSALRWRAQSGQGCSVEVAQWEALASLLGEQLVDAGRTGVSAGPAGYRRSGAGPNGAFRCNGDDAWVVVTVDTPREWRALAHALKREEWTANGSTIQRDGPEVHAALAGFALQRTPEEAAQELRAAGVPAMPVMHIGDIFTNDHFRARQALVEVSHPLVGVEWIYGLSYHLSGTPARVNRPAPLLGEHSCYVMNDLLGLSVAEFDQLAAAGALS